MITNREILALRDTVANPKVADSVFATADVTRLVQVVVDLNLRGLGKIDIIKTIRSVAVGFGVEIGLKDAKDLVDYAFDARGLN